ncbi:MAG: hypothetical protein AB1422_12450 [bacterium]
MLINNDDTYVATRTVTLSFTYADQMSGVDKIRYGTSSAGLILVSWGTPTQTATIELSADGTQTIYYQIKDIVGWISGTITDSIIVDTRRPVVGTITIIYPTIIIYPQGTQTRAKEGDAVTIKAEITDAGTGIIEVTLDATLLCGQKNIPMNYDGAGVYTTQVILSGTPAGTETLALFTITAQDKALNTGTNTSVVFIDNKYPEFGTITSNKPTYMNTDEIRLTVTMDSAAYTLTADFSPIDSTYRIGMEQVTLDGATYTIRYTIGSLNTHPDGAYSIWISARDQAANIDKLSISLELKNETPVQRLTAEPNVVRDGDTITFTYLGVKAGLVAIIPLYRIQVLDNQAVATITLHDDAIPPDEVANDGVYTGTHTISGSNTVADGSYKIFGYVYDPSTPAIVLEPWTTVTLDKGTPTVFLGTIVPRLTVNYLTIMGTATDQLSVIHVEYDLDDSNIWLPAESNDGLFDEGTESFTIKLSNLEEGTHTIKVRAIDAVGNESELAIGTFSVDTHGPVVTNVQITPPITNISPMITGTVTDEYNAPVLVNFYLDKYYGTNTPVWGTMTIGSPGSLTSDIYGTINVESLTDGIHIVYLQAKDDFGNWGPVTEVSFRYSRTELLVYISNIVPDPRATKSVTITGYVLSTAAKIEGISYKVNAGSWVLIGTPTDGMYDELKEEFEIINPPGVDEGTNTIIVAGSDTTTNVGYGSKTFVVDLTVPYGRFTINYDATYTTTRNVTLTGFEYDDGAGSGIDQIRFRNEVDTFWTVWQDIIDMRTWMLSAEGSGETRTVHMQVKDKAGNMATYTDTILYDKTAPSGTITILGQDRREEYATATTVALVISGLPIDIDQMRFTNNGDIWSEWGTATMGTLTWQLDFGLKPTEVLTDGTRTVWMEVKDISGKTAIYYDSIILDTTAPAGAITIKAGDIYSTGTGVSILLEYSDNMSGVVRLLYREDGTETWSQINIGTLTSGATTTTVTLTGGDGIRTVYYQIVDVVRWNSGTISDSIILDTTLPVTTLNGIISVQVKNDIIITGTATDILSQIVRVEYRIDSGSWIQAESNDGKFDSGTEAFSIILVELPEGTHTITAHAIDAAGNIGLSTSTTFLVDTQGPMLSNIQITPQITNKSPVITGTVTDEYNAPIEVRYWIDTYYGTNTPNYATMTILSRGRLQSDITGTINVSGLEEGEHTVFIQSMDSVGNWGEVAISKFIYSRTGLIVEITQAPAEITNQGTVSISGLAYNITGVKIIEIRCMLDDKNIGTYTYDTIVAKYVFGTITGFVDGTHTISIIAKDAALNQATATTKFFVDRTKPTIGTINVIYPTGQTRVKEGDVVTIKVEVTETGTPSGISQVLLDASNIGGEANQVMSHNGDTYTAQVTLSDTSPNIEIERLITIKTTDRANNYNEGTQTVFIDNKPPVFYSIDSNKDIYKDGETIILTIKLDSGSYTLRADFSDIDSTYQVGSETRAYNDGTYTITYTISLNNTIRDGKYSIPVFATDQANNITERHISIDLNNLATGVFTAQPDEVKNGDTIIFTYTLPQNGSFTACIINLFNLDSTVSGTVTMSDMGNGIYKLIHLISLANTCTSGTKIIHANIYDTKGNLFGSDTVAVVLDNQPPEVLGTISQNIRPKPVEKDGRLEIYVAEIEIFGSITGEARLVWWKSGNIISNKVIMVDSGFYFNHVPVEMGTNPVTIFVEDEIGNVGSKTVVLYRIEGKVSKPVGEAGGVVENPDGTKVEIPSNALLVVINISINTLPAEIEAEKKPVNDNIQLLGIPHEFGPSGIVFYQPVKMVFVYTDVDLERFAAKVGRPIDESELKIFFWDEERHDWIKVGGVVDANNNTIWVYVNHFTIYDLGIDTAPPPTQPAVYINRNPFKFGEVTEFMADLPNNTSKVTVRIFDLSGDLVRVITEDQSLRDKKGQSSVNLGSWDGMNDFGNYVGSGIYIYQVIITFTDGSTYVKTKPIGVVK